MATKNYLDLVGLTSYDGLLKTWVSTEDAKKITKIASATGSKVVVSKANGEVEESSLAVADIATQEYADAAADAVADDLATLENSLADVATSGNASDVAIADSEGYFTATNVEGALEELAEASAGGVASKTVYLVDESSGQSTYAKVYGLYQGADSADMTNNTSLGKINIPLDKVLQSARLVTEDGEGNEGYFLELTFQNDAGVVYVDLTVLADIYSGVTGSEIAVTVNGYNISAAIVEISGSKITNGTITTAKIADDAVTADKIAISTHTEAITAGADGLAISVTTTDGQVSGVTGSIAANTYDSYGSANAAKSAAEATAATYTDNAIADLDASVSQTAGTDGLALSITEVDGVITAISGSIASGTYEEAGAVSTAIAALDSTPSQVAGTDGLALSLTEVDGVVTAISGSIASGTYLKPVDIDAITNSDIQALFSAGA